MALPDQTPSSLIALLLALSASIFFRGGRSSVIEMFIMRHLGLLFASTRRDKELKLFMEIVRTCVSESGLVTLVTENRLVLYVQGVASRAF